jgi:predicted Zn-dependent protease
LASTSELDLKLLRAAALLESDPAAAARAAEALLDSHPGHEAATLLLGNARRRSGDAQSAGAVLGALASAQPAAAVVQLELARALQLQGRGTEALASFERALDLQPDLAEGWREASLLYAAQGDTARCDAAYERYTRLVPEEPHLGEVGAALATERLDTAESLLRGELVRAPEDVAALRLLAQVAAARERYPEAERLLGECLRLAPGYSRARYDLARILHEQQKGEPMLPLLERLLALSPGNLAYGTLRAAAYTTLGQVERALEVLAGLLASYPDNELVWLYYGHALRAEGRITQAIEAYRRSARLRPAFGGAWYSLANLKTLRFDAADIAAMRAQLDSATLPDADRLHFEFALGKAAEDAGNFDESFAHYARGNELRRAAVQYDPEIATREIERTRGLFTREFLAARAGWGAPATDPIFIVGLPRSGSTLLEQILASHSEVEGTRELPDVAALAQELALRGQPHENPYPELLARMRHAELAALGERYLTQTRVHRRLGRPRFIDKAPVNFAHVGLIHLILPNARIIDARRAALPCCFANFKQHFQRGVWFTYSLTDLGRYYRDYVSLMSHFDAVLPGRIHRVRYEQLVTDLDSEVRRLLDYCGLPFEEQCLRFHETRRVVQTVSSEQVRQPLYSDAIDQWRNFEPWLGPLKEALGDLAAAGTTP